MALVDIMPWIAGLGFAVFALYVAGKGQGVGMWTFPAGLSVAFFIWSLVAVLNEGLFGFWTEHTGNLWGNQIWFDLLLAIGAAWAFMVPVAKQLGVRLLPWLVFILLTGSIGLTAFVVRVLYLKERKTLA